MTYLSKYYTGEQPVALSPSAINEFITCSLRFYFHYIAGLSRPDEVVEEIDARILGNIMHKALKVIYTGLGQVHVDAAQLEKLLSQPHIVDSALDNAFSTELFGDSSGMSHRSLDGYNLIIRQIIRKYILQLIRAESRKDSFRLVSLEQKYITPIPVKVDSVPKLIHVGGIIDRVDSYNGKIRIIDYKTGSVKNRCSSVESLFDADNNQRNGAVLQVLLYTMVYGKLFPGTDVIPGLYFIRNSHASDFTSDIYLGTKKGSIDCYSEVSELFETLLEQRLASIFDRTEPFRQTGNLNSCRNCPFTAICRREE
jgi:ATP-dependent helicase/DNAse subunit B